MNNAFTKMWRYMKREYPVTLKIALGGAAFGAVFTAPLVLFAAPFWLVPASAAFLAAAGVGMNFVALGEPGRPDDDRAVVNDVTLSGHPKDIASVVMTQHLIDRLTAGYAYLPVLPRDIQAKIMQHVEDVAGQAKRVRGYYLNQKQVGAFSFTRTAYDGNGEITRQVVATVPLQKPAAEPVVSPPVESDPLPPLTALVPGFGTVAQKLDSVEKRIGRLEDVTPGLDKPRLSGPAP